MLCCLLILKALTEPLFPFFGFHFSLAAGKIRVSLQSLGFFKKDLGVKTQRGLFVSVFIPKVCGVSESFEAG
jgi:hypothetical protein